jgi:predicted metal-dependent HD superfamily phosphohydrolase
MTRVKVDVGRTSGNRSEQAAWSAERSALGKRLCGTPVIYHLRIYRVMRERERRRSRRNLTACCSRAAPRATSTLALVPSTELHQLPRALNDAMLLRPASCIESTDIA